LDHDAFLGAVHQEVEVAPLVGLQNVVEVESLVASAGYRCGADFAGPTGELSVFDQQIRSLLYVGKPDCR
jgi:hypothetical protein